MGDGESRGPERKRTVSLGPSRDEPLTALRETREEQLSGPRGEEPRDESPRLRTMVDSFILLSDALEMCPEMSFPEFEGLLEDDSNFPYLLNMMERVEALKPSESVPVLLAMMLLNLSKYSPGYERLKNLIEWAEGVVESRGEDVR